MGSNLNAKITVLVYGVPALLIVLGFLAYMAGQTVEIMTGDSGMKNFGIALMVIGIVIYLGEFALWAYGEYG